jgi:DNA repair exonuclease SbcCD ATPase subunit
MAASSTRLRRDLSAIEEKRTKLASDTERAEARLESAEEKRAAVDDLETAVYLGEIDQAKLEKARAEADGAVNEAAAEIRRLRGIAKGLAGRVASTNAAIIEAEAAEARAARDERAAACTELSRKLARALSPLCVLAAKLEKARAELDEADRLARWLDPSLPLPTDEPSWPSNEPLAVLAATIGAGPRRPNESAEDKAQKRAAEARRAGDDMVTKAVRDEIRGDGWTRLPARLSPIEKLPEGLRERAVNDFRAAAKQVPEVIRASREARLAELRELAKSGWARIEA